jgi:hypothetical protein
MRWRRQAGGVHGRYLLTYEVKGDGLRVSDSRMNGRDRSCY